MKNIYKVLLLTAFITLTQWSLRAQWVKCTAVPGDNTVGSGTQLIYLASNGTRLFVPRPGKQDSIFYSDNSGGSWNMSRVPPWVIGGTSYYPTVTGVWVNGGVIFASGSVSQGNVFWRSTNNGVTWAASSSGIITSGIDPTPKVFTASGNTAYVGTGNSGIFLSTDNGLTWSAARSGIPTYTFSGFTAYANILSFARIGNDVFAGLGGDASAHGYGVRHTTLGGTTWDSLGTGLPSSSLVYSLISVGTTLYAWAISYSPPSGNGLYKSTDLGVTWTNSTNGLPNLINLTAGVQGLYAVGNTIFADTYLGGYVSTDGAGSWTAMDNTGLPATYYTNGYEVIGSTMFITVVDMTTLPATTAVWKRDLSQITEVREVSPATPRAFSLKQNYPNPFNPSTKIRFDVRSSGFVSLTIYDVLGKEVATLVNGVLRAGSYEATFDASQLASGVYIYRLHAGVLQETKRMLLVR
jgi:hypothetical protein